jgi:hypothetical protein
MRGVQAEQDEARQGSDDVKALTKDKDVDGAEVQLKKEAENF